MVGFFALKTLGTKIKFLVLGFNKRSATNCTSLGKRKKFSFEGFEREPLEKFFPQHMCIFLTKIRPKLAIMAGRNCAYLFPNFFLKIMED